MIPLLLFFLAADIVPFGEPIVHPDLIYPNDIFVDEKTDLTYVLDIKAKSVMILETEQRIGKPGEGPGEFASPVAMQRNENGLYVFDGSRGRMSLFNLEGEFIRFWNLTRGPSAVFDQDSIVIHTPLGEALFVSYTLQGDLIGEMGEGMGASVRPDKVYTYMHQIALSQEGLFTLSNTGESFSLHSTGETPLKLAFDFEPWTRPHETKQTGAASFSMEFGEPVHGLAVTETAVFVLAENEYEKQVWILAFDRSGKPISRKSVGYFTHLVQRGNVLYLFDRNEATIHPYRIVKEQVQ